MSQPNLSRRNNAPTDSHRRLSEFERFSILKTVNGQIMDVLNFPFYFKALVFHYPA